MALLAFEEEYIERMWGGQKLRTVYGKETPDDTLVGEAWMIADHPQHISVVAAGPDAGRTLRDLLEEDPARILGVRARLTVHGRFPLLLKLLDAGDALSIQVHPDDDDALRLGEPDVGKTEMWYVLQGDEGSELYCGMSAEVTREAFEGELARGTVGGMLTRIPALQGTAVFVEAGTVHAIGGGSLLAEIQQNSDLTYRLDDWGRVQSDGTPRELHVEKAIEVTHFGSRHHGASKPLAYAVGTAEIAVLAACRYFAAERVTLSDDLAVNTGGESFTLLLGQTGTIAVEAEGETRPLPPGSALMVTGSTARFTVSGEGSFLKYYVPGLQADIVQPLLGAGHTRVDIVALGGDPGTSDLAGMHYPD